MKRILMLSVVFMAACNSLNKPLPEMNSATNIRDTAFEEGSFKDENTMIVYGDGLSGSSAKNSLQKQEAQAIEHAAIDAQRKAIEICIGVSVAACNARPIPEKDFQAAIKVGFRQFGKKCDFDARTNQTGCHVGYEFRMKGLRTYCASKDAERRSGIAASCMD